MRMQICQNILISSLAHQVAMKAHLLLFQRVATAFALYPFSRPLSFLKLLNIMNGGNYYGEAIRKVSYWSPQKPAGKSYCQLSF